MPHFQGTPFVGTKLGQHDGDIVGPGQINDLHHLCQALGTPQACSHMRLQLSGQHNADGHTSQPEAAPALLGNQHEAASQGPTHALILQDDHLDNEFAGKWGFHPSTYIAVEQCIVSPYAYGWESLLHCTLQCHCGVMLFVQMISNCDMPAAGLTAGLTPNSFSRASL